MRHAENIDYAVWCFFAEDWEHSTESVYAAMCAFGNLKLAQMSDREEDWKPLFDYWGSRSHD